MPKLIINAAKIIRPWPRIEKYQNSTLRFSPPVNFPEFLEKTNGKPKLMRCWITLDEVWDYRTDEYHWDYQIGVNRYEGDPNHHSYDWRVTVPSQIHIKDYLLSHSQHCDEILFNIRRYENETERGIVSLDKYEEVVENVIAYYKKLCPNIRYIEVSNESDYLSFGGIDSAHYYKLYKRVYSAVSRLNDKNKYELPLGVGGTAINAVMDRPHLWREFLQNLANDKDERRMIDFYSVHDYNRNPYRISEFYQMHHAWIEELGLPDLPIFVDEYGFTGTTGIWTDSLKNASGVLRAMLLSAKLPGLYIMPWCTFHNPSYQMSFTQFLQLEDGSYVSTPNGNAMRMLAMLKEGELEIDDNNEDTVVATGDEGGIAILATNPEDDSLDIQFQIDKITWKEVNITQYMVDTLNNNYLMNSECRMLKPTRKWNQSVDESNNIIIKEKLDNYGFCLWVLEKCD